MGLSELIERASMLPDAVLAVITAVTAVAIFSLLNRLLRLKRRSTRDRDLRRAFKVPSGYEVMGSDVGGEKYKGLIADGLIGRPDAWFCKGGKMIVGEFKNRRYNGKVRPRERYQVTLYLGMLVSRYGAKRVQGHLRFRDKTVRIKYDPKLYRRLLSMREDVVRLKRGRG